MHSDSYAGCEAMLEQVNALYAAGAGGQIAATAKRC